MKSNYKRLGNYIQEVNVRNVELNNLKLLGVSIAKVFIPSIANIIGTDMSTYKIIKRGHFAYGPVTSRNGDKISIALLETYNEALISQSYVSFEIIDENELMPEYLMMWFRRPEFDRYARYMSHGSTRETFDWVEMCNTELPVPSIEKQREIVDEYQTIVTKIDLNNKLIEKLDETSQTIYKQWFIEFEFPDKKRKSYKMFGGEMVFHSGLEKLIPLGWEVSNLSDIAIYLNGLAMQQYPPDGEYDIPVIKIRELSQGYSDETSDRASEKIPSQYVVDDGDVIFSWSGTLKVEIWAGGKGGLNQHLFKVTSTKVEKWFYYLWTKYHLQEFVRIAQGKAVSLGHIKREHLREAVVLLPTNDQLAVMNKYMTPLIEDIINRKIEKNKLIELSNIILSKMAKEGNDH